ncbi:MAG: OprO/OprP family phosphate-selective porin [Bacteroidales bacterium]|jgi:hypothetical protein|nr:OprO/OprP family phosphate-selective porin [Bacteroidales bacterium]
MKKHLFRLFAAASFFVLPTCFCLSQETDTLNKKISKLETVLSKLPKVGGLLNLRYQYEDSLSSFSIRRACLEVKGDASRWFDYRLQVEFASAPKILDAYIRAKIKPYFNVQFGQFQIPFSLESPYAPFRLECMDNAQVITKLVGYDDIAFVRGIGRDIGVMFYGGLFSRESYAVLEYSIGIFNGAGINTKDNNTSKDIVARIDVHPLNTFTLSASGYVGEAFLNDSMKYETRNRVGFGLRYDDEKWLFRSEYIYGLTSKTESMGAYAVLAYTFIGKLQPVLRVDYFQRDLTTANSSQINYTVGLNYWIIKRNVGLQANYTYQTFSNSANNAGIISAMATFVF